jgi:adenylate cyclase
MSDGRIQRRLAAILAADVVGYTRMMNADEVKTRDLFNAHFNELLLPTIASHGGRVVKTMGDGLLAEFPSVVEAVQCADGVQSSMADRNAKESKENKFDFRIGINIGDVIVEDDDIHGEGVNIASRLEAIAEAGSVYLSSHAVHQVAGKIDVTFDELGEHDLKNIDQPVLVYRLGKTSADDPATFRSGVQRPPLRHDKASIAVLPFVNLSGDPDQEYFSEGVSEDIIAALGHISWLFVIARSTSFGYSEHRRDPRSLAAELGVAYVLDGSIRRSGKRIRLTAQLVEGTSGQQLWSRRFDRELEDLFAIQDDISESIAGAIEPELVRSEQARARLARGSNLPAWDLYQRATWHSWRRTETDLAEALRLFEQALSIDPDLVQAYAGAAEARCFQFIRGFTEGTNEVLAEALRLSRRGVELDGRDSYARYSLGRTLMFMRRHAEAKPELEVALEINPNFAPASFALGNTLSTSGRAEEGIALLHNAMRLSPRDPQIGQMMIRLSDAHLFLKQYDEALIWARRSLQQPNIQPSRWVTLISVLGHLGRLNEVAPALGALNQLHPNYPAADFVRERYPIIDETYRQSLLTGLKKAGL